MKKYRKISLGIERTHESKRMRELYNIRIIMGKVETEQQLQVGSATTMQAIYFTLIC